MNIQKSMKKISIVLLLFALILLLPVPAQAAASIRLNTKSVTLNLKKKKTTTLKATIKGTSKKAKWTSSNKQVATVSQKGKVTARKAGKTIITAAVGNKKAKCTITVNSGAGRTGTYTKDYGAGIHEVAIKKISGNKITFQVRFVSMRRIAWTDAITAKITGSKGNKVYFKYENVSWGGAGKAVMVLSQNYVKIKLTNTNGREDYLTTGSKTITLKRTSSKKDIILY